MSEEQPPSPPPRLTQNEIAMYEVLARRGKIANVPFSEYLTVAREVASEIPPEKVTPIEELLDELEKRILSKRESTPLKVNE